MRLVLCVGEGLGNIVQVLPLANILKYNKIDFEILNLSQQSNETVSWLFSIYAPVISKFDADNPEYIGRIELATTKFNPKYSDRIKIPVVNDLSKQNIYRPDINEIEVYLQAAKDLGLLFPKDPYDVSLPGILKTTTNYDVVIHNGSSLQNTTEWQRKKYPYMKELAAVLHNLGLKVASIGHQSEYSGGEELCGKSIEGSATLINNCGMFISNDTGTYHLAAALKKQSIAIFTATSTIKNYHPAFHRNTRIVTNKVECQPCQYMESWEKCSQTSYNMFKCREIPIAIILKELRYAEIID